MDDLIAVASIADMPVGMIRGIRIGEMRLALYRTERGFFATDDTCPHRGGPLSEGDLSGNGVICPWHAWKFDLETGQSDVDPDKIVRTYEVVVNEGTVYIRMSSAMATGSP